MKSTEHNCQFSTSTMKEDLQSYLESMHEYEHFKNIICRYNWHKLTAAMVYKNFQPIIETKKEDIISNH